ncbi:hypothetical protein [Desulfonema ishimotonii]|uniref:hypothetical protein n=1 Tax=Desulfonema ishimotonii TaxID=45657 RepID=UPI000F56FFE2|nr:hypothetical protein [Desulfonema ishimotonii]
MTGFPAGGEPGIANFNGPTHCDGVVKSPFYTASALENVVVPINPPFQGWNLFYSYSQAVGLGCNISPLRGLFSNTIQETKGLSGFFRICGHSWLGSAF